MLGSLGLTEAEESVYRLILGRLSIEQTAVTAELGLPEPVVDLALARLVSLGLATQAGGFFTAAPPAVALGSLITQRRDDLRTAELALASFAEEHRAAVAGRSLTDLIEVVSGVDAIRHRFLQVQYAAREQVRNLVTTPYVAVPPGENPAETAAADRGVRVRVVLERATLTEPGTLKEVVASLRTGVQIRVAETLPMKLILADSELGLVPLGGAEGEPGAVLLQRSGLLSAMEALFEGLWARSYPLELSSFSDDGEDVVELESDGPNDLDRKIIALLLTGMTDQAVSAQLDVSMRTLQRRLRRLMDIAGVETRMQLGWYAARQGWG